MNMQIEKEMVKLDKLHSEFGVFDESIVDEMIRVFRLYKSTIPMEENLITIESKVINSAWYNDTDEGLKEEGITLGAVCYLTEDEYRDIKHKYYNLCLGDYQLRIIHLNNFFNRVLCSTRPLALQTQKKDALIYLSPIGFEQYIDYVLLHELGHIVKVLKGFNFSTCLALAETEEIIANILAVEAYHRMSGKDRSSIVKDQLGQSLKDTQAQLMKENDLMTDSFIIEMMENVDYFVNRYFA